MLKKTVEVKIIRNERSVREKDEISRVVVVD
jgi:hypothetical protein